MSMQADACILTRNNIFLNLWSKELLIHPSLHLIPWQRLFQITGGYEGKKVLGVLLCLSWSNISINNAGRVPTDASMDPLHDISTSSNSSRTNCCWICCSSNWLHNFWKKDMGVVSKSTTYPAKINQGVDERFTEARSLWIQLYCKITNVRVRWFQRKLWLHWWICSAQIYLR